MRIRLVVVPFVVLGCASDLDTGVMLVGTTAETTTIAEVSTTSTSTTSMPGTTDTTDASTSDVSTTDASSTTMAATSGETEGVVGSPCGAEQEVCVLVELDGRPAGACGETLEIKGIAQASGPGVWTIEDCGACELCGGPSYDVEFIAPEMWAPTELPLCTRIGVTYADMDASAWSCSFVGVAVWADDGLGEESAPRYVGRSIETSAPPGVDGLLVNLVNIAPEPCAESACCAVEPGKYEISFTGAGIGEPVVLAEHEDALDVHAWSRAYDLHVERAHAHKECGKTPHFDWVFMRSGG